MNRSPEIEGGQKARNLSKAQRVAFVCETKTKTNIRTTIMTTT